MERQISAHMKQRYDTKENWERNDPVLLSGELAIESDTSMAKIGNGHSRYTLLPYMSTPLDAVNVDNGSID